MMQEPDAPYTIGPEPVDPNPERTETVPDTAPETESAHEATPDEPDTFSRDYVQDLRKESQRYREQLREYEGVFDQFSAEDRPIIMEYLRTVAAANAGDPAAVQKLQEYYDDNDGDPIGDQIAGQQQPQESPEEAYRRIAREEAERVAEERFSAQQQQQQVREVVQRAESLGYKEGSVEYRRFLDLLINEVDEDTAMNGDPYQIAHEMLQKERQQIIDDYLASKEQAVEQSPRVGSGQGASPQFERAAPTSWAEVRDRVDERFRALQ